MTSTDQRRYRQRGAPIIHDTIDNETIAINQQTGAYYSLEGAAALVWQRLAEPASDASLTDLLESTYDASAAEIDGSLRPFLRELLDEELIVAVDHADSGVAAPAPGIEAPTPPGEVEAPTQKRGAFPGLRLQRYNDLEVMLLADPIHEVDDTGWPMPLADPPR